MPTGTLRRLCLVVSAGLALVGLIGGCSGPDQPSTLPSDTPAPTSSSPSPSPLTVEQEVEAAVRAYYAELTRAAQTNDPSALRALTTKVCPCYRPVRVISRNAKRGLTTPEAAFSVSSIRVHDLEGRSALAEVRTSDSAYKVLDREGAVVGEVPAREHFLDLTLVEEVDDRWIVVNEFDLMSNS